MALNTRGKWLEDAKEYRNGELAASLGSLVLRGSNILYISISPQEKS